MFYIYVIVFLIVKKNYKFRYNPINAELVYLSRAVFALTAITHSSPQDFSTVHWNKIIQHFICYSLKYNNYYNLYKWAQISNAFLSHVILIHKLIINKNNFVNSSISPIFYSLKALKTAHK